MSNFYLLNGKFFPLDHSEISIESRALRYGEGVFETIRIHNGKIPLFDLHAERFLKGLDLLQLRLPSFTKTGTIRDQIDSLVRKNNCGAHARIRLSFLANDGGVWDRKDDHCNILLQSWELPENYRQFNINGLVVDICEEIQKSTDVLSNLKSNNYLPYLFAANKGKRLKVNDMLVLNGSGHIVDSTIANVFVVRNGSIMTPPLYDGPVAGVMRRWILENLQTEFHIEEKSLSIEDILSADEVFLTNAVYGIRWVQRIRDSHYESFVAQKIYNRISKHFETGVV